MAISEAHFQFAKDVDYLNNPQKYLGPTAYEVLKFWSNLDNNHQTFFGPNTKQILEFWGSLDNILSGCLLSNPPKIISKTLFTIAKEEKNVDILNNPQKYFGPHTDQLLNFWNKLEGLSLEQHDIIFERFLDFSTNQKSDYDKANNKAYKASDETIGEKFANITVWVVYIINASCVAQRATREIIGGIQNPVFLPMFDNI